MHLCIYWHCSKVAVVDQSNLPCWVRFLPSTYWLTDWNILQRHPCTSAFLVYVIYVMPVMNSKLSVLVIDQLGKSSGFQVFLPLTWCTSSPVGIATVLELTCQVWNNPWKSATGDEWHPPFPPHLSSRFSAVRRTERPSISVSFHLPVPQ